MDDTDTSTSEPGTEQTTTSAEANSSTEQANDTTETGTGEPAGDELDALPEWARKRLTKANAEAGKYRTRLREVEAKLSEATSPEQAEVALGELREANAKLERDLLVELTELLQGARSRSWRRTRRSRPSSSRGPHSPWASYTVDSTRPTPTTSTRSKQHARHANGATDRLPVEEDRNNAQRFKRSWYGRSRRRGGSCSWSASALLVASND